MDTLVTRLQVGPHNRDQQPWNRQLLMLDKLPVLFPCLREINFDQVPLLHHMISITPAAQMALSCCLYLSCGPVLQEASQSVLPGPAQNRAH